MYFVLVLVTCLIHVRILIQSQIIKAEEYTVCKSPSLYPCNCGHGYYDGAIKYIVNCTSTGFNKTSMLTQLPQNVEVLIFAGNSIRELPVNLFGQLNSLSKLQTIDMTNNQIRLIHGKTYHHVSNVKKLILNHNELEIDDDNHYSRIFSNFVNLLELHLTNAFADRSSGRRKEFTDDLYDIFMKSNLSQLYKLHLEQNEIEHFHEKNLFCNLQNLHDIYLSNNLIETFDFNIDCLNKIRFIDLEFNRIEFLNETHFNLMDRIAANSVNSKQTFIVDFKGNEFHCDNRFIQFYEWIRKSKVFVRDYDKITCYKYSTGHMKSNETICSAAAREVLEETGIVVECTTLLMVECASGSWFRFILTGKILGGFLKNVPDSHSLQAQWIQDFQQVSLRSNDCLPLIEHAKKYYSSSTNPKEYWHEEILPCLEPHANLLIRLVTVIKKKSTNRLHVLVSEKIGTHLPVFQVYPTRSLHSTLHKFMIDTFGADMKPHKPHGILTLEHGSSLNGFCISILVSFKAPMEEVPIIGKCFWQQVSKDLGDRLIRRIAHINSNIPLHVIQ